MISCGCAHLQPSQSSEPRVNVTTWLGNLQLLAGSTLASTLASTGLASDHDTFYTKSLMTPSDAPMSQEAIAAFASWMSVEGWNTSTVRVFPLTFWHA